MKSQGQIFLLFFSTRFESIASSSTPPLHLVTSSLIWFNKRKISKFICKIGVCISLFLKQKKTSTLHANPQLVLGLYILSSTCKLDLSRAVLLMRNNGDFSQTADVIQINILMGLFQLLSVYIKILKLSLQIL